MANFFRYFISLFGALCTFLYANSLVLAESQTANTGVKPDKWTIYWYLCGSDLESLHGSATNDILELLETKLPPEVEVVIETGGSNTWQNNVFQSGKIGRYLYGSDGLNILEELPDGNMGDKEVLKDFLRFSSQAPAEHKMFIFWDHGGGTIGGISYDERTHKSLSLNEVREAFSEVYGTNPENPPFDIVGFDACLMGTLETANSIHGIAKYMVASQEVEPGNGWEYKAIGQALSENPDIDARQLGKIICDSYLEGCQREGTDGKATLSLIDMAYIPDLVNAYEAMGQEALSQAAGAEFFTELSRACNAAENYGGNTKEQGYFDLIDLGNMSFRTKALFPNSSDAILSSLRKAVAYKVNGIYRTQGMGLSVYYPLSGNQDMLAKFQSVESASPSFKEVYGKLLKNAELKITSLEDLQLSTDGQGTAIATVPAHLLSNLSEVRVMLGVCGIEDNVAVILGDDTNVIADWEKGIFKDNFNGTWASLDGHLVCQTVEETKGGEYTLYAVPIKLNGIECNLQVAYDFGKQSYEILGATRDEENNIAIKDLIQLKPGDEITTLHYASALDKADEVKQVEVDTFKLGASPVYKDIPLEDGLYCYMFEFVTPKNEEMLSDPAVFRIINGKIQLIM